MLRAVTWLARASALLGGTVLSVLIALTCLSVAGRIINSLMYSETIQSLAPAFAQAVLATGVGPINGDFELVEAGMAFAIFAFLPLCQLQGGHAMVDIFTAKLPVRFRALLQAVIEVVFAGVLVLIALQVTQGALSKKASGQTTLLLEFPLWWAYASSAFVCAVGAFVAVYRAALRVAELCLQRALLPDEGGAEH